MRTLAFSFFAVLFAFSAFAGFEIPRADPKHPGYWAIEQDLLKQQKDELRRATKAGHPDRILRAKNEKLLNELQSQKGSGITRAQAQLVYDSIEAHPLVNDKTTRAYDTPRQQIGFCFGRATYVHWELLRRGVDSAHINKLFAVGKLAHRGRYWEFHVATIVKAKEGGYWVIDRLQPKVLDLAEWMKSVNQWTEDPARSTLRFYQASPEKFRPLPGAYSEETLFDPLYQGYFRHMVEWFSAHPATPGGHFIKNN